MVAFSSVEFLFRFLPVFLAVYYITPKKYRNTTLLFGSIVFYAVGEPYFILLLLASVWFNYILAVKIRNNKGHGRDKQRRNWLITALLLDIGLLVVYKIAGAVAGNALLPLGLSFYTFKMISFQMDVYRGEIAGLPTFKRTAVYFMMFPQLVSGPIMRYNEGDFTLGKRSYSWEQAEQGIQYFIIGLGTKVLLADRLAILGRDIQAIGYESISTPLAWLGAAAYSMQLYFDFWGYSLMASGLCVMLGFSFIGNFNHPYASKSISEFWRRWHMTLGSFFRDYVYIPLGGSRNGRLKTIRNLLVVWLLTGLWHGGSLNFILWGLVMFMLIVMEKLWLSKWLQKFPLLGRVYVLLVIPVTWVLFAVTDLQQLTIYLARMFPFTGAFGIAVNPGDIWKYLGMYAHYLIAGVIWCIPAAYGFVIKNRKNPVIIAGMVVLFWLCVYCTVSMGNNPFAYLKF